MNIKLSSRLTAVASMVRKGSVVADIGTDHGYLPAYLISQGISPYTIASDVSQGPLNAAKEVVELLALGRKVDLRLGDGLKVLSPGEADTICIAGMGDSTIIKILAGTPDVLTEVKRLVLQPMRGTSQLRRWLMEYGWDIVDEELVFEGGLFYEIIGAQPGECCLTEAEIEVGPVLMKKRHTLLKKFLQEKIASLELIGSNMEHGNASRVKKKQGEVNARISMLKQVMECL
ncbi:MAG: class I SAM-dependent methyltransferase [Desulfitobacteriaceae bacterium]|nr:class I SAM-dependent methyltransferase [Desulfitobacteriaceae bacterium]MDD4753637.1 class I SAM-dependent methyltransferase [Desulfitobacteriaceae bacterium]